MTFRFRGRIAAAALLLLAAGCATLEPPQTTQEPPEPYVRVCRDVTNRTEFQIALRKFAPEREAGRASGSPEFRIWEQRSILWNCRAS